MLFPIGDDNIDRGHPAFFSYGLLLLNVGIFLFQISLPSGQYATMVQEFGAVPAEISSGTDHSTLVTSIFLHGGWMHLLGNMLYLWIFADNIEAVVGNLRFILFYLLGGVTAGLVQVYIEPSSQVPCIGASGAIAAVMGAYIMMFPRSRVRVIFFFVFLYIPAWVFLGFWFLQQVSSGLGVLGMSAEDAGGVAWWAHIGGFVYGAVLGVFFRKRFVGSVRYVEE